jgi:Mandelate racemase / muconate lactonizing enzyme, N-terminal domain
MKITAIETVRIAERPNLIWLRVETDEGVTGLGETFFGAATVEAHVHEYIAPRVIGRDPLEIDRLSRDLMGYVGFRSTGAEMRGNSAFDIALWDLRRISRSRSFSGGSPAGTSGPTTPAPAPNTSSGRPVRRPPITAWVQPVTTTI